MTAPTREEVLEKIRSIKLCLMAHPDNEDYSEFADRISDLEEIEQYFNNKKYIKVCPKIYQAMQEKIKSYESRK